MQEKRIRQKNGLSLDYTESGEGVPVVLLHGLTDSKRSYDPVLPLLPRGVRALAITQRGHGGSDKPDAAYDPATMADDVADFLDALGIERAWIVGHSMGAAVASVFAANHAARTQGLVLIGAFHDPRANDDVHGLIAAIEAFGDEIPESFAREFQEGTIATGAPEGFLDIAIAESCRVPAFVWLRAAQGMLAPNLPAVFKRIAAPTLVLWGDQDAYCKRTDQDAILTAIPQARVHVFEGIGHALHWERPEEVAALIGAAALNPRRCAA